jgi:hypothetical protein
MFESSRKLTGKQWQKLLKNMSPKTYGQMCTYKGKGKRRKKKK